MYPVSTAFQEAIRQPQRKTRISLTLIRTVFRSFAAERAAIMFCGLTAKIYMSETTAS